MSDAAQRKKIKEAIDRLPSDQLSDVADYVAFLCCPAREKRVKKGAGPEIYWKWTERERQDYFLALKNAEAEAFFHQYVRFGQKRLASLERKYFQSGGRNEGDLDFEPSSLEALWIWVSKNIRRREYTPDELRNIMGMPDWFRDDHLAHPPLSDDSRELLNDVAYYFAEALIRMLVDVKWQVLKSNVKRLADRNEPVIGGPAGNVNPRAAVLRVALNVLDGKADTLLDAFDKCARILTGSEV